MISAVAAPGRTRPDRAAPDARRGPILGAMTASTSELQHGVVVGYVPTRMGNTAVTAAIEQARFRGVGVVIVNVVGSDGYVAPTAADELDLDALTARLREEGLAHEVRHVDRQPSQAAEALIEVAEEIAASLVVVGLHRRSRVGKMLMGSNAQRVLLGAPCPVLTVRDDA